MQQVEEAAQSMAALLDAETATYPHLRRGAIIEGTVVGSGRDGVLVDLGAKSEGVIPPQEMRSLHPEGPSCLKAGDKVLVFVVQPETPEGQIVLSLDRARGERGWRVLQEYFELGTAFEARITGFNKGGLLVNVEGVNTFVPLSQIEGRPERGSGEATERALAEWVGKPMMLKVIELNRHRNRAILSARAAMQERRAQQKDRLLQELREGDIRRGQVSSIRDFGVFVDIGGADGLVHLSELSWERTPNSPADMLRIGDEVDVYIVRVDKESRKIALSIRRAQPERWEDMVANYREGQIVTGQVTKLAPFGAFVRLEGPVEGLIHISELADRRLNHPREVVGEGEPVPVKILRIEHDRHRLGLSLRQAREKAEEEGWAFDGEGRVVEVPAEVRAAFPSVGVVAEEPLFQAGAADDGEVAERVAPEAAAELIMEVQEGSPVTEDQVVALDIVDDAVPVAEGGESEVAGSDPEETSED